MSLDLHIGDYSANITYNLSPMFNAAFNTGNYWADDLENHSGAHLLFLLDNAIHRMIAKPEYYKQFNASNGWGVYDDALPWLIKLRQGIADNIDSQLETYR